MWNRLGEAIPLVKVAQLATRNKPRSLDDLPHLHNSLPTPWCSFVSGPPIIIAIMGIHLSEKEIMTWHNCMNPYEMLGYFKIKPRTSQHGVFYIILKTNNLELFCLWSHPETHVSRRSNVRNDTVVLWPPTHKLSLTYNKNFEIKKIPYRHSQV